MKKRLISLLLVLTMLMALCACGGNTTSETAEESASSAAEAVVSEAEEAPEVVEEVPAEDVSTEEVSVVEEAAPEIVVEYPLTTDGYTFTCWTTYGPGMEDFLSQVDALPAYEKATAVTGVGIEFIPCDQATQPEKMNLYIASGSMPDVMLSMSSLYSTGGEGLINDEVAYDLNQFIDLMPYYDLYIDSLDEDTQDSLFTSSGYLPAIMTLGAQENVGLNIRKDWLDELGLEIPKTYDQLETVLLAFKDNYGCQNTLYMLQDFGYTNYALAAGYDTQISAAMNGLHFYVKDGKVYSGDFNDGAKDYLLMLADWYQKGLFSDDCITFKNVNDNPNVIYRDDCGVWVSEAEFLTDAYTINAQDPDFNPAPMPDVGKEEGQMLHMYASGRRLEGQSAWSVTTSCEEPELVCQFVDWFFSPEGQIAANWGEKGVTYDVDAEGNKFYTDLILHSTEFPTPKLALTMYTGTPLPCGTSLEASDALTDPIVVEAGKVYRSNQDGAYTGEFNLSMEDMMQIFSMSVDILTRKGEVVAQIVMGEADISALDELEAYAYECGLEQILEIYQTAYDSEN